MDEESGIRDLKFCISHSVSSTITTVSLSSELTLTLLAWHNHFTDSWGLGKNMPQNWKTNINFSRNYFEWFHRINHNYSPIFDCNHLLLPYFSFPITQYGSTPPDTYIMCQMEYKYLQIKHSCQRINQLTPQDAFKLIFSTICWIFTTIRCSENVRC